jgi:hypothetical protein
MVMFRYIIINDLMINMQMPRFTLIKYIMFHSRNSKRAIKHQANLIHLISLGDFIADQSSLSPIYMTV